MLEATQTTATARSCGTCVHFMPSTKEQPGRGLCAFYSLVRSKDEGCRYGYTPRKQSVKNPSRAS